MIAALGKSRHCKNHDTISISKNQNLDKQIFNTKNLERWSQEVVRIKKYNVVNILFSFSKFQSWVVYSCVKISHFFVLDILLYLDFVFWEFFSKFWLPQSLLAQNFPRLGKLCYFNENVLKLAQGVREYEKKLSTCIIGFCLLDGWIVGH